MSVSARVTRTVTENHLKVEKRKEMSFNARVYRVLIASPGDVAQEREIAVDTIQSWNDLNSAERQLVLLPLRWETHSAPEYGRRPQEVINRQVVDHADLLVGVFWTRVGSPTGVADSGTLEEIERVASQGKPILLYFSQAKQDPDLIDLEQLQRLREFKRKTFPKALIETYSTIIEFRDKLARQIEIQLRTLIAEESQGEGNISKIPPITDIQFEFADLASGNRIGQRLEIESAVIELEGQENLPDFGDSAPEHDQSLGLFSSYFSTSRKNKDYYRDMVRYLVRSNFFRPIRFWLKNVGGLGARDVYVDIRFTSESGNLTATTVSAARLSPPGESMRLPTLAWGDYADANGPQQFGNHWTTKLEIRALQPQRDVSPGADIVIGAAKSGLIMVTANIYADTLPEPVTRMLHLNWKVTKIQKSAIEILQEAGVKVEQDKQPTNPLAAE